MSKELTPQEKDILISVSYLDLPPYVRVGENNQRSLYDILNKLSAAEKKEQKDRYDRVKQYLDQNENSPLHDIKLYAYQNHNPNDMNNSRGKGNTEPKFDSGFVGYAFTYVDENDQPTDEAIVLFRGSEANSWNDIKADWGSNFTSTVGKEIDQQIEANRFYEDFVKNEKEGNKLIITHSKGSNLNQYTSLNNLDDKNLKSYMLNGQPIAYLTLTEEQIKELNNPDRFEYVATTGDIVHKVGYTPYDQKRIKAEIGWGSPFYTHSELSIQYDENGQHIKASIEERNIWSDISDFKLLVANLVILPFKLAYELYVSIRETTYKIIVDIWKGALEAAEYVKEQFLNYISKIKDISEKLIKVVENIVGDVIKKAKLYFKNVIEKVTGNNFPIEPYLKVNMSRLSYYESRLRNIKSKTNLLNDRIDELYLEAGIMGLDNVLKADILTSINWRINQNISYINNTAEILNNAESLLVRKARSIH
jgi:hypothetical protein